VVGEGDVPLLIAKESVKLAHGWVLLFICPSEFPILEMYLFEVTSMKSIPKSNYPATVGVGSIFVPSTVYLIEVTRD
jgi:hypothetical protein